MNLTWLYAPAHTHHARKAIEGSADVVILDLEDAVAPPHKAAAREVLADLVGPGRAVDVRVNAARTPWHRDDIRAVSGLPVTVGVRVPKVESPEDIESVIEVLPGRRIHALIETALGLEQISDICRALPDGGSVGLGEADLASDLGSSTAEALRWARGRVVVAAAAAGLEPPAMSVFANLRDEAGLRHHCQLGRRLGFVGQAAIHPAQLPVIEQEWAPSAPEADRAFKVLESLKDAQQAGDNTLVLPDGSFLDPAMIRLAERTAALHQRTRKATNP